ncbi:hypothetical protein BHE74_00049594 [Ensete ventricosum]|nr:hypothetical protein BHE74_00049594 [Ensete ventricosum]
MLPSSSLASTSEVLMERPFTETSRSFTDISSSSPPSPSASNSPIPMFAPRDLAANPRHGSSCLRAFDGGLNGDGIRRRTRSRERGVLGRSPERRSRRDRLQSLGVVS